MSFTGSVWFVVILGVLAANTPFFTTKLLGIVKLNQDKSLVLRLLELLGLYGLVGAVALFLEKNAGQMSSQGWEFYAITGTVFLTFAFPGFVFCYLLRHK